MREEGSQVARVTTTTEDLYGTRTDASPQQRSDLRHDVEVPKGTQLLRCKNLGDRWQITVLVEGRRTELITFRDPTGKTTGERLGPRFPNHTPVTLKRSQQGQPKGARGVIVGIAALDSFKVDFGGTVVIIGAELLSLHKVAR